MKISAHSIKQRFKRYRILSIVICSIILLLGGYIIWSKYEWDTYQTRSSEWRQDVQTKLDAALAMKGKDVEERKNKLKILEESSQMIAQNQDVCKPGSLTGWQRRLLKSLDEREEKCHNIQEKLGILGSALDEVVGYLEGEQSLASLLARAPHTAELAENTWEAQAAAWHEFADQVSQLSTDEVFKPTKQAAINATKKVDTAWQAIVASHKAQDRVRYQEAQAGLIQAYAGIGGLTDIGTKQFEPLVSVLDSAYNDAF